jgi:hypothetical protein
VQDETASLTIHARHRTEAKADNAHPASVKLSPEETVEENAGITASTSSGVTPSATNGRAAESFLD